MNLSKIPDVSARELHGISGNTRRDLQQNLEIELKPGTRKPSGSIHKFLKHFSAFKERVSVLLHAHVMNHSSYCEKKGIMNSLHRLHPLHIFYNRVLISNHQDTLHFVLIKVKQIQQVVGHLRGRKVMRDTPGNKIYTILSNDGWTHSADALRFNQIYQRQRISAKSLGKLTLVIKNHIWKYHLY